jgi:electron transport complex protein RnfE
MHRPSQYIRQNYIRFLSLAAVAVITLISAYVFYSMNWTDLAARIILIGSALATFIVLSFFIPENPVFISLLGLCPTLAVTTNANNGIGMGVASTFVLIGSNSLVSILRKVIPEQIRIPAYITIIASFVTIVDLIMAAFSPELHHALGIFIPLIVVNCIILGRAEAFAGRNALWPSILDGLYKGIAFTLALATLGLARELFGNWSLFSYSLNIQDFKPILIMILPPGAFILLGLFIAVINLKKNPA